MINIKNMSYHINGHTILKNVNLRINKSGLYGIYGHSGSGKTTLINIILGLKDPSNGEVKIGSLDYRYCDEKEKSTLLKHVFGVVFQKDNLFTYDTVFNNLKLIFKLRGISNYKYEIKRLLRLLKMEGYEQKYIYTLSGGEKKRIAFLMALAKEPLILILDEPTSSLDEKSKEVIRKIIKEYAENHIVIVSSHDVDYLKENCDTLFKVHRHLVRCVRSLKNGKKVVMNRKNKGHFPFSFFMRSAHQKTILKKWRVMFMNGLISIGLMTIGYSSVFENSINETIYGMMKGIFKDNAYILSYRDDYSPVLMNLNNVELEDMKLQCQIGVVYETNFSNLLEDKNNVYLMNNKIKEIVPNCGLDDFNLFIYDDTLDLKDDEIVVTLSENLFKKYRNSYGDLYLVLEVENINWSYSDEEIFKVAHVELGKGFSIKHSNKYFNQYVIEDVMSFKSIESSTEDVPWRLNKKYYFKTDDYYKTILELSHKKQNVVTIPSLIKDNCYYPFLYYPFEFEEKYLKKLCENYGFDSYLKNTIGIYNVYPSAFMSGFARSLYLSNDSSSLNDFIDEISNLDLNAIIEVPNSIGYGEVTNSSKENVLFKNHNGKLNENELIISKKLYEKIGGGNYIHLSYLKEIAYKENIVNRRYENHSYLIKEVIEDEDFCIFQNSFWLEKIFPHHFNLSLEDQIVTSITLYSQDNIDSITLTNDLLEIVNPLKKIKDKLENDTKTLSNILLVVSFIVIFMSAILVYIVSDLFFEESKVDLNKIKLLGGVKKDLIVFQVAINGYTILPSFICSSIGFAISVYMMGLSSNLGVILSINSSPFVLIFIASLSLFLISISRVFLIK